MDKELEVLIANQKYVDKIHRLGYELYCEDNMNSVSFDEFERNLLEKYLKYEREAAKRHWESVWKTCNL